MRKFGSGIKVSKAKTIEGESYTCKRGKQNLDSGSTLKRVEAGRFILQEEVVI